MPKTITLRATDCLSSIAYAHGFSVKKLWEHPDNEPLRAKRSNPYVLKEGDVVCIPDRDPTARSCETTMVHTFRRKDVPEKFKLQLHNTKGPRKNVAYTFVVEGEERKGNTDGDGKLEEWIPPNATRATLRVHDIDEHIDVQLGRLEPVTELRGLSGRLYALGFLRSLDVDEGAIAVALHRFQQANQLHATGELDDETRQMLEYRYGS